MALKRIAGPANEPVTLAEAKAHLVVEHAEHDTLIEAFIAAATEYVDGPRGFLGRAVVAQTWDYFLDEFPDDDDGITLPLPPLIEVLGVYYQDADGAEQTLDADHYVVDAYSEPARISLPATGSWPTAAASLNAVRVRFRAGYVTSDSPEGDAVPKPIRAAILLQVGSLYRHREDEVLGQTVERLTWTAEKLLRPHRFYLSLA